MALPSFCRNTVTVTRAPFKDERGTEVRDWSNAETHELTNCYVRTNSTGSDRSNARDAIVVRGVLHCQPGADIKAGDKVTWNGVDYALDGAPLAVESPTGAVSHIIAYLVNWEG